LALSDNFTILYNIYIILILYLIKMLYSQEVEVGEEVKKGDQITSVIGKQLSDKISTQTILYKQNNNKKYQRKACSFECLVSFNHSNGI
jgi:hypothetical protein